MSIFDRVISDAAGLSAGALEGGAAQLLESLSPRRILIYRPDHLGDLVLFSGALKHIRRRWPSAHVSLAAYGFGRQLFANCPYVDSFLRCEDLQPPLKVLRAVPGLYWAVKAVRTWLSKRPGSPYTRLLPSLECDLAILPTVAPSRHGHAVMDLIPARVRIGIRGDRSNQKPWTDLASRKTYSAQMDAARFPPDFPESEAIRLFLKFLGIEASPDQLWPEFWTDDDDRQNAKRLLGVSAGHRLLGIAPGNANPLKRLPAQWYASALAELGSEALQVALLGGPSDVEVCNDVARSLQGLENVTRVVNLAGQTSIRQMIECLRLCDAVLAQETAALHMATALRKPVVGITGGGHFGRFYPWGDPALARVVTRKMDCFGCNWACKYATMRCIQEIPPSEAAQGLKKCLAGG
jgi:ADP-heptose:LPS heptosyltransferase